MLMVSHPAQLKEGSTLSVPTLAKFGKLILVSARARATVSAQTWRKSSLVRRDGSEGILRNHRFHSTVELNISMTRASFNKLRLTGSLLFLHTDPVSGDQPSKKKKKKSWLL